jgi:hypothetical protein
VVRRASCTTAWEVGTPGDDDEGRVSGCIGARRWVRRYVTGTYRRHRVGIFVREHVIVVVDLDGRVVHLDLRGRLGGPSPG